MKEDCIFCKIASGAIPSAKVYEDEGVLAFLDIAPVEKGHTLVISKRVHTEALPDTPDEIVQTFGVRLYFDETGTPSLLSFGQFGSSYKGKSGRLADRAELQAQRQARALADSALTTFINSFADMTDESLLSEDIGESRLFHADGTATPEEVSNIIDIYRSKIKQTGSDTMKGRTTVYDRVVKHPSGQRVAVCVRRWSFGQVDAVNEIINQGHGRPTPPKTPQKPNVYDSGVRSSRTYDF